MCRPPHISKLAFFWTGLVDMQKPGIAIASMTFCDICYAKKLRCNAEQNNECDVFGRTVTRLSLGQEVYGSNLGPVKSDTELPTACHRCDISSKEAKLPGRNDAQTRFITYYYYIIEYFCCFITTGLCTKKHSL